MSLENLLALKARCEAHEGKEYNSNVPSDLHCEYKNFFITACKDMTIFGPNKVLGISRKDKKVFDISTIPEEVFEIFPAKVLIYDVRVFPFRGFTMMFCVK